MSCSNNAAKDSFTSRNDTNCVIGHEDLAKEKGSVGSFSKISLQAILINVKIGENCITVKYDDATRWTWSDAVKNDKDLKEKKGCLFIDVKKDGDKEIATEIRILPAAAVPNDQLIEAAELKKLMGGIPGAVAVNEANLGASAKQLPVGEDKKRAPIVVYGAGRADRAAAHALAAKISGMGYANVTVLDDGFAAYAISGTTASNRLAAAIAYAHKNPPGYTDPVAFHRLLTSGKIPSNVTFIEVREKEEVKEDAGITRLGGVNIPLGELKNRATGLDKSRTYYTICATGSRAETGRDILASSGLTAHYVAANVTGPDGADLTIEEKLVVTREQIAKALSARLVE